MSFLNKNKLKSESASVISSTQNDLSKKSTSNLKNGPLMQSLDDFRQGLRQQISDKLKISTNKYTESPSPRKNQSPKSRLENLVGVRPQNSPSRAKNLFQERFVFSSSTSARSSDRKPSLLSDLHKRIDERSPQKKSSPSKDFTLLSNLDKKFNASNKYITPMNRSSMGLKNKSPLKEYNSNYLEERTSLNSKNYVLRSSYLNDRMNTFSPSSGAKDNLLKILDRSGSQIKSSELFSRTDSDKPRSALTQAFGQLKSNRISSLQQQSPDRRNANTTTPRRYGADAFRSLGSLVSETGSSKDRTEDLYSRRKVNLFNGTSSDSKLGLGVVTESERGGLVEKLPLNKLFDLQEAFRSVPDKDFNNLSSEYIEQLIKLSSIIMQRVKDSTYYSSEQ